MKILIVYDSKHGTTEEVAGRIADSIKAGGSSVEFLNLRDRKASETLSGGYDAIALGAPFYAGRWSRRALAFAAANKALLAHTTLGIFAIGSNPELGDKAAKAALPASLANSVAASAYFGGRVDFGRLGFFERLVVKAVSGKAESSSTLDLAPVQAFGKALAGATANGKRGRVAV